MFLPGLPGLLPLFLLFAPRSALGNPGAAPPTVRLDQATVYGIINGSVTSYLNFPFAEPPYAVILVAPLEYVNR